MPRLFFGLPLPRELRPRALEIALELRGTGLRASWVPAENLHFTMTFLGEIPRPRVPELTEGARTEASRFAPFDVAVAGAGAFPGLRRPRVLWIGGQASTDTPALLAARLDGLATTMGVRSDGSPGGGQRPFRLHCTIARVRPETRVPGELAATLQRLAAADVGTFRCDGLVLFESQLGDGPARYTPLATLGFRG